MKVMPPWSALLWPLTFLNAWAISALILWSPLVQQGQRVPGKDPLLSCAGQ